MATDEMQVQSGAPETGYGQGLLKGLAVTLKTMLRPAITQQYPRVKPNLPARSRGVIALMQENCTVCYKCARECPDWCIYIDAHKETHEPASGGKGRSMKVLDRFAIDYALCMYCGICVEVCPFDALFWSPEFEYATYDIVELTHEKEKLQEWTYTVVPPPELEEGAIPPVEAAPAEAVAAAAPAPAAVSAPASGPVAPAPAAPAPTAPAPPAAAAEHKEVSLDQETFDRLLAELLEKGTERRVAEGQARRAAMIAARKKAEE
jgi:NADH-quinone oxidoreductase subunit I